MAPVCAVVVAGGSGQHIEGGGLHIDAQCAHLCPDGVILHELVHPRVRS